MKKGKNRTPNPPHPHTNTYLILYLNALISHQNFDLNVKNRTRSFICYIAASLANNARQVSWFALINSLSWSPSASIMLSGWYAETRSIIPWNEHYIFWPEKERLCKMWPANIEIFIERPFCRTFCKRSARLGFIYKKPTDFKNLLCLQDP